MTSKEHGVQIKVHTNRVAIMESKGSSSANISVIKVGINSVKKKVTALNSMDISSLWGVLDLPL